MASKSSVFPNLRDHRKFTFAEKNTEEEVEEEEGERERKRTMFYSQCLLSSKGPLGAIWVAGYFFKRLKKRQITDTDISSSVDKILLEGFPSVTYRILAYLLLGVVRIYSKKVEYLFQDCHETVSDINRFSVGKKVVPFRDIVRSSNSISLPESYELDSFQLEVADSVSRSNIARSEDISLRADTGNDVFSQYSFDKQRFEEDPTLWEDLINGQTSHGVTIQRETTTFTQTPDKDKIAAEKETSISAHTPPEKVLSPHQMEFNANVCSSDHIKNFKSSKEKLRELRFTGEEDMDVDRICELDVELLNLINDYQVQANDNMVEDPPKKVPVETNDNMAEDFLKKALLETNDNMAEDFLKKTPLENQEYVIPEEKEVPSLTEMTQDPEVADARVGTTPKLMFVPTPAKKENVQRPRKRKCMFDDTTVLSNEIMKQDLKDASSLMCKRRKAPHTALDLWRLHRIPALLKNFSDPLIPGVALELKYIHCGKKPERTEVLNTSTQLAVKTIEAIQIPGEQHDPVAPIDPDDNRSAIAPGTPVQCPASARVFATDGGADSDGEGVHSNEISGKELSMHEEDGPGPSLMTELDANEADSTELHKNKNEGLSARTRNVATYLRRVIQRKKKQGVETVTFLPIVERKSKRENARLFFELLVLSSGGLLNVAQDEAYGDVVLQETPKLEATLKK